MSQAFLAWWRLRSQREQRLLLLMSALLAVVLGWLLVIQPLSDALESARQRHSEAVSALAEARARAGAAQRLRGRPATRAPLPVDRLLSRTATEAGFAGARIAGQGPGRASIALDAARPQAIFTWILSMEQAGLVVETLSARANPDRTVAVEAAFKARRS
jgi:general secretion pathway protein M